MKIERKPEIRYYKHYFLVNIYYYQTYHVPNELLIQNDTILEMIVQIKQIMIFDDRATIMRHRG